jgi:hypothetical protein
MRRTTVLALGAIVALLALGGAAFAKEGAITKFDSLPSEWHAGQNYTLGYMIRMDGVEPYKADTTEIVIRNGTGKVLSYPGTPDGTPGHYTAKVYFPAAGTYTWQVTQGSFFAPMDLGTVSVLAPVSTRANGTPASAPASDPLGTAIPIAAALIAVGAGLRLARLVRTQRRAAIA